MGALPHPPLSIPSNINGCAVEGLDIYNWFQPTFYNEYNYFSTVGWKSNHASKMGRRGMKLMPVHQQPLCTMNYRQISNISRTLIGNRIIDHSDVVGAPPVGAAPTTSPFSASIDCAKTTARRDKRHLSFVIWCGLYQRFGDTMLAWLLQLPDQIATTGTLRPRSFTNMVELKSQHG